ncbi:MAG: anti-sigma regulatory factor [Acidobacteria bacterium]|nr:anti-sigma regulatory factor [Acidobacteriota bacterium]
MAGGILHRERFTVRGNDFERGGEVAAEIKRILKGLDIDAALIRRLSIANFEAEMNVVMYADEAAFELAIGEEFIEVVVTDRGPGIEDVAQAMQIGFSTATPEMRARGFGAGLGLPNIQRNADEFEITSTPGKGTTLRYLIRTGGS